MEPIGQKTAINSSEETIFTADLGVESVEKETEKIFDSALDKILTEETDYEKTLQELLVEDGQDSLISYVHQNQFDSEIGIEETVDALSDYKLLPNDVIKTNLDFDDSQQLHSKFLQNSVPIPKEIIELNDPRIVNEENNFVGFHENGIAETGLQSLLDEPVPDSSKAVMQQFLHQVDHSSNNDEISEEGLQKVLEQNYSKSSNSEQEVEIPRSSLHTIMHKISNQPSLVEEEVSPEVSISLAGHELKSDNPKSINQQFLAEELVLPEESTSLTGHELKSDNPKSINQQFLAEELVLPEETVTKTSHDIKSEINNNLVRQIQKSADIEIENQKFIPKIEMPSALSNKIEVNYQDYEISGGDNNKNLLAGSTLSKEQLKARESLQLVENFKAHEVTQSKASHYDIEEFATEAKSKFSHGLQIPEQEKSSLENQDLIRPQISNNSKLNDKFKVKEDLQGLTIEKAKEDLLPKELVKSLDELKETVKVKENFLNKVSENTKVSSDKLPFAPVNHLRTLASNETKLSGNSNSGIETIIPSVFSASSETSGTSIYKTTDSMNSFSDSLRNVDLPFDIQQLASRVRIMRGNGVEEMTLRLHPEELGHITLKIKQSGGDLMIDMRVDNPTAKQIVESGFDTLRSRFLDQEFAYKDLALNVDINQKGSQFGSDRQFREFEDELFSSQRGKEQEIAPVEETPLERHRTDSGLNLYI